MLTFDRENALMPLLGPLSTRMPLEEAARLLESIVFTFWN